MLSLHPGPVTNPCIVCSKSVRANQQGVSCDSCEMWTHVNCCGINKEEYQRLQSMEKFSWKCPSCLFAELPYADHELSDGIDISLLSLPDSSMTFSPLHSYTNRQSLMNKMDELRSILSSVKRLVFFGISETWLNSSISDAEVAIPSYDLYR